jgi:hypothetical protein
MLKFFLARYINGNGLLAFGFITFMVTTNNLYSGIMLRMKEDPTCQIGWKLLYERYFL